MKKKEREREREREIKILIEERIGRSILARTSSVYAKSPIISRGAGTRDCMPGARCATVRERGSRAYVAG